MLIGELILDTPLSITVTSDDKMAVLDSKVIELTDDDIIYIKNILEQINYRSFVAMELVTEDDMAISFLSPNVSCKLTAQHNGKPYLWKNVKIVRLKLPDTGYAHVVFCNDDVNSFNRRMEYRLWLDTDVLFKINDSNVSHRGILKDISNTGAGIIVDASYEVQLLDKLHIQFYDSVMNKVKKEWEEVLYSGVYTVIRILPLRNNRVLLGCALVSRSDAIAKLINRKQRERLKHDN